MFIDEKQKLVDEKSKVNIPTETSNGISTEISDDSLTEKFSLPTDEVKKSNKKGNKNPG